jgi:hypothetical protein
LNAACRMASKVKKERKKMRKGGPMCSVGTSEGSGGNFVDYLI